MSRPPDPAPLEVSGADAGRRLRVSLDVSAVPQRPAGAGRYTLDLAIHLAARADVELHLLSRVGDAERWERLVPGAQLVAAAPAARPLRLLWEQANLPRLLDRMAPDLHHGPHYTMPEGTSLPRVVTIHDLTVFDHPEWHQRSKVGLFRRAIRVASRHADGLVCGSEATASRLRELLSPEGQVLVVPYGVDHARFRPHEPEPGADERTLAALGVQQPYVVFVGTIDPRKDVPTLVRSFDRMCPAHPGLSLVLAGGRGWDEEPVDQALAEARHPERVRRLGYVPDAAVPALLRGAAAAAYPLLRDGFGLPVLEAMACASRLVTTNHSALEEVAAGSALMVPPGDAGALAGALDMLVTGDADLAARQAQGLRVAAAHTWEASAAGHVRAYRLVIEATRATAAR